MSFGDSNMARGVLGTSFSLLLLASIIQGFRDVELFHYEQEEAVVGHNITLPCIIKTHTKLIVTNIEWTKRKGNDESIKLFLYSHGHGQWPFWPNLTLQIVKNEAKHVVGSYLHLPEVKEWDSAIYICEIATFPLGSLRSETKLSVEDDSTVDCDMQSNIVIHNGENVTIDCNASLPGAQYSWTKNKNVVSKNASLELWRVTDANAGIYTLTVNMGKKTLRKEFNITVLLATTSLRTDPTTISSSHHQTETTDSSLAITTAITANIQNTSNATHASEEHLTSSTDSAFTTVASSPTPSSNISDLLNTTASSYVGTVFRSTQEIVRNQSELQTPHPEGVVSTRPEESSFFGNISESWEEVDTTPTLSTGNATGAAEDKVKAGKGKGTEQGHLLLVLIVVPILLLIAVAGFLYRRRLMKKRMDLPPPFKPPPPPVKYTAPRRCQT